MASTLYDVGEKLYIPIEITRVSISNEGTIYTIKFDIEADGLIRYYYDGDMLINERDLMNYAIRGKGE